ncbi:hypothetical protein BMS3Bbin05_00531 [bacterium BMS3Bbin05]|nr:hypothetical protein BMS3Bbin05_00531 [bacterium BMS3Bbin05]
MHPGSADSGEVMILDSVPDKRLQFLHFSVALITAEKTMNKAADRAAVAAPK